MSRIPVVPSDPGRHVHLSTLLCTSCGAEQFRRSRLRRGDLLELALFRWPVRCLQCNKRYYASRQIARRAISASAPHNADFSEQTWQAFTSRHHSPAEPHTALDDAATRKPAA